MAFEDLKSKLHTLEKEKGTLWPTIMRAQAIDIEADRIRSEMIRECERQRHPNAQSVSSSTDIYEQRTYAKVVCPDCNHVWEERVRCGKFAYPKSKDFKGGN